MRDDLHITEAKSQNELAKTSVTPATAKFLSIAFLVLITFPAALQIAAQVRTGTVLKEFRALAGGPSRENLRAFEQELDNAAILRYYWQPRIQELLHASAASGTRRWCCPTVAASTMRLACGMCMGRHFWIAKS